MGFKSLLVRPFARRIARKIARWSKTAVQDQADIMQMLASMGANTAFGRDHAFSSIKTYEDWKKNVPVQDYEGIKSYIERIKNGESDVLWRGKPRYFAKTSGTTSGMKYIPITADSLPFHFGTSRDAVFNYAAQTNRFDWLDGKVIFLSGSPELDEVAGIPTGRLSGISNHLVPSWLKGNQKPSYETNCIEDWETKLDKIVAETLGERMALISGIPPWVQMYYEKLIEKTGKKYVKDIFPDYSIFVYGGVNFEPYRAKLEELVGKRLDSVETYPASEGFIAFQDQQNDPSLLLNTKAGIFYEFIPVDEFFSENPTRISLKDVQVGVNYVLILNTNAGLFGYNIGDTVRFVSTNPYRIVVTGRIKHYISAFGEHVIGKEVEEAILEVANAEGIKITEFHVAPQVNPAEGLPYHEWLVEFDELPTNLDDFAQKVDVAMTRQNAYYDDLIGGNILRTLVLTPLRRNAFREYMQSQGKLGGQNKVPRLANDRKIADALTEFKL